MTVTGNSNSNNARHIIRAAIQDVDVANQHASAFSKKSGIITIDCSHYTGAVQVTPVVGEQWYVEQVEGTYRLHSRIPFNDPNDVAIAPAAGQHVVGSGNGPVELNAGPNSTINAHSPLAIQAVVTGSRPAASSVPAGTSIYDSTLGKPIWSNGSTWHDASGATV